jgi:O-antigen biosynthesis protein
MKKIKRYARKGITVLRREGVLPLAIKSLQKLEKTRQRRSKNTSTKTKFISLVDRNDAMVADWSGNPYKPTRKKRTAPYTVNWIMSPPSGGGGHQNIFRFIEYLDAHGYANNVYLYSTNDDMTIAQARENVSAYCKAEHLTFQRYKGAMIPCDVVFATGWETAYPVFNDPTDALKMYFVQDFEPYFYPMGSNYILAENTYRFGFHGITAGNFLAQKLSRDYGMRCDSYNFGAEPDLYQFTNKNERKEIFFYARPVTERRGFDLGIMTLELFHAQHPEYVINLAGWDVSDYDLPFPYVNHKALQLGQLSDLYNRCSAALVISLTNMSLLPLELLACGTIPVVNEGPNNQLVSDNKYIAYTQAAPAAMAHKLSEVVTRKDAAGYAQKAAASVGDASWQDSLTKFESILRKELS